MQVADFLAEVKGWIDRLGLSPGEAASRVGLDVVEFERALDASGRGPSLQVLLRVLDRLGLGVASVDAPTAAALVGHLDRCRESRRMSKRTLAERAGVDRTNLQQLLSAADPDPRLDTVLRLAAALECDLAIAAREDGVTSARATGERTGPTAANVDHGETARGDRGGRGESARVEAEADIEESSALREVAAAWAQAEAARSGAEAARNEAESARAEAAAARAAEARALGVLAGFREENAAIRAELEATREEAATLGVQLDEVRKESTGAAAARLRVSEEGATLRAQLESARKETMGAKEAEARASKEAATLRSQLESARKEITRAKEAEARASKEAATLRSQLDALQRRAGELERSVAAATAESAVAARRKTDAEGEALVAARGQLDAIQGQRDTAVAERDRLRRELDAERREVQRLRPIADRITPLRAEAEGLREQLGQAIRERDAAIAERVREQGRVKELSAQVAASSGEGERGRLVRRELDAKIAELTRELSQAREDRDELELQHQDELDAVIEERDDLGRSLAHAEERIESLGDALARKSVEVVVQRRYMRPVDLARLEREIDEHLRRSETRR